MPEICFICGSKTQRLKPFSSDDGEQFVENAAFNLFGFLTSIVVGFGLFKTGRDGPFLDFSLPVCKECKSTAKHNIKHIDMEYREITILAHKAFIKAYGPDPMG